MSKRSGGDVDRALAQPFTPGMGNGVHWDAVPDDVAVAPPTVAGRDQRTTEFLEQ